MEGDNLAVIDRALDAARADAARFGKRLIRSELRYDGVGYDAVLEIPDPAHRIYPFGETGDYLVTKDGRLMLIEGKMVGVVGVGFVCEEIAPGSGHLTLWYALPDTNKPIGPDGRYPQLPHNISHFWLVRPVIECM